MAGQYFNVFMLEDKIKNPHEFDKFSTPSSFMFWKIRFKTQESTCSDFFSDAVSWIKEVEMVDSVDDLKTSCSIRGIRTPGFERSSLATLYLRCVSKLW